MGANMCIRSAFLSLGARSSRTSEPAAARMCRLVLACCAVAVFAVWLASKPRLVTLSQQMEDMHAEPFAVLLASVSVGCVALVLLHQHLMVLLACVLGVAAVATTRSDTPVAHSTLTYLSSATAAVFVLLDVLIVRGDRLLAGVCVLIVAVCLLLFHFGPVSIKAIPQLALILSLLAMSTAPVDRIGGALVYEDGE